MGDLPFGKQFTSNQIELGRLLELIDANHGNKEELESAIRDEFHSSKSSSDTMAYNTRLAASQYGLITTDDNADWTEFGERLYEEYSSDNDIYTPFAKHILIAIDEYNENKLNGLRVLQTIADMKERGMKISLETLPRKFNDLDYDVPKGGEDFSAIRSWLDEAEIVTNHNWDINIDRLEEVLGVGVQELHILDRLPRDQQAFLRALCLPEFEGEIVASNVADHAERLYGIEMSTKDLPKKTLEPLENKGYIEKEKATGGRGAKSYRVERTDKFDADVYQPVIQNLADTAGLANFSMVSKSLDELFEIIRSDDRHEKGMALEALALRISNQFFGVRSINSRVEEGTGGIEIDGLAEQYLPTYSLWQIQAKNQKTAVGDLKREVGAAQISPQPNVVLFITTHGFTTSSRQFVQKVMRENPVTIILVDKEDISLLRSDVSNIEGIFEREANRAKRAKLGYLPDHIWQESEAKRDHDGEKKSTSLEAIFGDVDVDDKDSEEDVDPDEKDHSSNGEDSGSEKNPSLSDFDD